MQKYNPIQFRLLSFYMDAKRQFLLADERYCNALTEFCEKKDSGYFKEQKEDLLTLHNELQNSISLRMKAGEILVLYHILFFLVTIFILSIFIIMFLSKGN